MSLQPFLDHSVLKGPVDWGSVFGNDSPVEVEIGIGNGEYLAKMAQANPAVNYVGFEEYCERVCRSLRKLSRVTTRNARVMRLDVRPALRYFFAPKSVRYFHCLFPPPWPKKSDIKHRLMTTDFLKLCNSRLIDGGVLKVVTDFKPYADWLETQVEGSGFALKRNVIGASHGTKFEQKWEAEGQRDFDEILLVKQEHREIPLKEAVLIQHYLITSFDPARFKLPQHSNGTCAVVGKDFLFDPLQQRALVYCLVSDEDLVQHVRIAISRTQKGWHIGLSQGCMQMPTPGIAVAIACVRDAAAASAA